MVWPTKELGELTDICRGSSPRPIADTRYFDGGTVPWVKIADATKSGKFLYETKQHVNDFGASFSRRLPPGTILVAASGTLGYTQILGVEGCAHDGWLILKNLRDLDRDFAYYALKTLEQHFFNSGSGAAIQNINTDILRKSEIPHPPLPIQQRVAGILSAYDELIENSQRRIKILETMAHALYREWFVHFRFPGPENHPRVASPLGEIPLGWEVKALGDVCSRITDGSHFSPQSVADGYPMASVKDMHDWGINVEGCRRITIDDYENLVRNDCKPLKNDVLIAKDGSYLKHTFVVGEEQDLVILSSIAMLRPNDAIRPNYLCFALRDPVTKARMKGIVSGVAIPRIVLKDFRKFQILVPPDDIQADWARIVDPMLAMCRKLVSQTENLLRTRDLLLPRLLSGQIEVEAA